MATRIISKAFFTAAGLGVCGHAARLSKHELDQQMEIVEGTQMSVQQVLRDLQSRIEYLEAENAALTKWRSNVEEHIHSTHHSEENSFQFLEVDEQVVDGTGIRSENAADHSLAMKRVTIPEDLMHPGRGMMRVPGMNSSFLWIGGEINGTYAMNKGCFNATLVASTAMCREWANFTSTIFLNNTFNTTYPPGCIYHKNSNKMVFNFAVPDRKTNITHGVRSVCYGSNPYVNGSAMHPRFPGLQDQISVAHQRKSPVSPHL